MRLLRAGPHPNPPPEGEGVRPPPGEGVNAALPVFLPPPLGEGSGGGSPANTSKDRQP